MGNVRAFLALDFGDFFEEELARLIGSLKYRIHDVKWVNPGAAHITLHFFGEISEDEVPVISVALTGVIGGEKPLRLFLNGFGAFPGLDRPRVYWVGIEGDVERLNRLQKKIEERLAGLRFPVEARAFKPHLTVGRNRGGTGNAPLPAGILSFSGVRPFLADHLTLFRSDLSREGPRYSPLCKFQLENVSSHEA